RIRGDNPPPRYILEQVLALGPFVLTLSVAGFRRLWRDERGALRSLAIAAATVEVFYLLARGKSYYPLDIFPVLMAAGAVAVAGWARRARRVIATGMVVW